MGCSESALNTILSSIRHPSNQIKSNQMKPENTTNGHEAPTPQNNNDHISSFTGDINLVVLAMLSRTFVQWQTPR